MFLVLHVSLGFGHAFISVAFVVYFSATFALSLLYFCSMKQFTTCKTQIDIKYYLLVVAEYALGDIAAKYQVVVVECLIFGFCIIEIEPVAFANRHLCCLVLKDLALIITQKLELA